MTKTNKPNEADLKKNEAAAEKIAAQEDGAVTFTAEQFTELKTRVETLQKERDEYLATAQRVQADFDNFRRRNAGVRAESIEEGTRETVKALIGALDSLERALKVAQDTGETGAFADGVALVHRQFYDTLCKLGLCEIPAQGEPFDPELHNAVMQEACEEAESGTVTEVLQKGYKLKDKIVRHAMVKVAQ